MCRPYRMCFGVDRWDGPIPRRPQSHFTTDVSCFQPDSDLSDQVELVRLTLAAPSLDELAHLWSGLLQAPFLLSVAYQAGIVFIDG